MKTARRSPFALARRFHERLLESPLAHRLARGAWWSLVGGIGSRLMSLLIAIITARIVGKVGYGELGMVQSTIGMAGAFIGFGLGSTATKYISQYRISDPDRAGRIAGLSLVTTVAAGCLMMTVLAFAAPWLATKILSNQKIGLLLTAGALLLFTSVLAGVLASVLAGFEAFRAIAGVNLWQGLLSLIITVPLVYAYHVQGAVAALTITTAAGIIFSAVAIRGEYRKHLISDAVQGRLLREWPVIVRFSVPAAASGAIVAPTTWFLNTLLANQHDGYGQLGLFHAANQWRMAAVSFFALLASGILPVLSHAAGSEDPVAFRMGFRMAMKMTWIIALPLVIIISVFGNRLAQYFGPEFADAAPLVGILMAAMFLDVMNSTIGIALTSAGRMWTAMGMNFGWAMVMILAGMALIPRYGALGLAMTYLVSYMLHTLWQTLYFEFRIERSTVLGEWRLALYAFLLICAAVWISSWEGQGVLQRAVLLALSLLPLVVVLLDKLRPACKEGDSAV